ncbi:hypothetical protein MLD38_031895 [Melastoma candidum]|uniref:Uncharacterized protein n=1 Tax=Melastoma candidum TaxID=119954 RepID=A0ACB9MSV3_9MYRT|nr:hypothetical protein MLD38_031895 [Melastoma candidum]
MGSSSSLSLSSSLPVVYAVVVVLGSCFFPWISLSQETAYPEILVHGSEVVAETDDRYVCATLDWWPHDKCNYGQCPWGYSSAINLNLLHPVLGNAIRAFGNLRIRVGGSLQDQVVYDVGDSRPPCSPFQKAEGGLFGFSKGCLHMRRWDELNALFQRTGATVTFGLNALSGREPTKWNIWVGDWDSNNAYDFIKYTISRGYPVDSWEFGNELCGTGVGARVAAEQYAKDLIVLKSIIDELYKDSREKPLIVTPGGFFDREWFTKVLEVTGSGVIDVLTHHIYNLGAGVDPNLMRKILDPIHLSQISTTFSDLKDTIHAHGPWAAAWVGESGGAYNNGGRHVSNTFINSFWYLDQLGMAAKFNTKVYCRQTLIGGNYGLLNTTTLTPNPDYYGALLWHRLMGRGVLAIESNASPSLRLYAHCSKGRAGISLLLINLGNEIECITTIRSAAEDLHSKARLAKQGNIKTKAFFGGRASDGPSFREEYRLTPHNGFLQSQTVLLNGNALKLTKEGDVPEMKPHLVPANTPVSIAPLSISFIVLPDFHAQACA